jgi:hypothetical protein
VATIDIFNGDADGICALIQLRLSQPRNSRLVTGVKRDVSLMASAAIEAGDEVIILDISMEKNHQSLCTALKDGARCFYVDHHFAGDIPEHKNLEAIINTAPDVCTSILVNQHLHGAYTEWALVGAFGDNLKNSARALAKPLHLDGEKLELLERLGIYINYNGYGAKLEDLQFPPADLYRLLSAHASPFNFVAEDSACFNQLEQGYLEDMEQAQALRPEWADEQVGLYLLPNAAWARRVSGVFSNYLANDFADRAHAVLTLKTDGNYLVSVRAPLSNKTGADDICRKFATGGGRKAAAGINDLPADDLPRFVATLRNYYKKNG